MHLNEHKQNKCKKTKTNTGAGSVIPQQRKKNNYNMIVFFSAVHVLFLLYIMFFVELRI